MPQFDLTEQLKAYKSNKIQARLLDEAGITSPTDPMFMHLLRASLDFTYHAQMFFPDPNTPNSALKLEPWQKVELNYAQWGDNTYDKHGTAIRKPIAINSPRGFGKSVFSAVCADEFAIHFPYTKLALFSTSQEQANDLMDKVRFFIKHSIYAFMINKKMDSKTQLGLINGSIIKAFPQSEVTIRGYHPHIKIVDEKARIKREILESAIRPMGRKVCWLELGISTPFGMNNNHYEDCSNVDVFHVKLLKPTDVSWVDEKKLALEVKTMGDRIARQELYAEFIEDADTVFKPYWIEKMLDLHLVPQLKGIFGRSYIMGLDFGKLRDYAAFSIIHTEANGQIVIDHIERHLHVDYNIVIERARELCNIYNIKLLVPDGNSVGIAILEQLERKVKVPIYMTQLKTKDKKTKKEQYRLGFIFNNISKLNIVDELVKAMMNFKIKSPHHFNTTDPINDRYIYKVLENEMIQFSYERTNSGNITFGHPEDGKSHDDTLISLMLAVWGIRYAMAMNPVIRGVPNVRMSRPDRMPTRDYGTPR